MENLVKIRIAVAPFLFCMILTINASSQDCIPTLAAPENGTELDNGCDMVMDEGAWYFDWENCEGASKYHLYVEHYGATYPVINNDTILVSDYAFTGIGYILDRNRLDWRWKVRAMLNDVWGEWSEERSFDVEPLNTDCQDICIVRLSQPENGQEIDNGCKDNIDIMNWLFDWTACENVDKYHLRVENTIYDILLIDNDSIESAIFDYNVYDVIPEENQFGWQWKVRTYYEDKWGPWSEVSNFWVEEPNTDCPVTGIEEVNDPFFTVYPNPATAELMIRIEKGADLQSILISDLHGSNINSYDYSIWNSDKQPISIPLDGIHTGIYILQIETSTEVLKQKLIVK